jgi:adenosylhomocysteine nucleosidase
MEYRRHITSFGPLRALCVMAAELEYGEHLARRITPLITGIGPVEAAVATTAALASLHQQDSLPDAVLSLGSAGSRRLEHTAVYQVASVAYRDMDATALGVEKGRVPFLDLPAVVPLPAHVPGVPVASLSTGGAVISGAAYGPIEADMVDMETYAVLRAAQRFGLPLIGLRGVSDGRKELTGAHDWREYLHVVDERLAQALDLLAAHAERHGAAAVLNPHQEAARTDGLTRPA